MKLQNARRIQTGDTVLYIGRDHVVVSINPRGIWAPHFRLTCDDHDCPEYNNHGTTSYLLVQRPA